MNEPLLVTRFLLDPTVAVLMTDRPALALALRAATAGTTNRAGSRTTAR